MLRLSQSARETISKLVLFFGSPPSFFIYEQSGGVKERKNLRMNLNVILQKKYNIIVILIETTLVIGNSNVPRR